MTFLQVYMGMIEFSHVFYLFCSGSFSDFCLSRLVTSLPSWLAIPRLLLGQDCHSCKNVSVPSRCSQFVFLFSLFNCVFSLSERASMLGSMSQSWDSFHPLPGPRQAGPVQPSRQKSGQPGGARWLPQLWASPWGRGQEGCGPVVVGSQGPALLCCQRGRDPQPWGPGQRAELWGWAGTGRAVGDCGDLNFGHS